jgi:hypothetical protein
MPEDLFDQIRLFLPKYLTPVDQRQLFEELRRFPANPNLYLPPGTLSEDLLQGDGWQGLVAVDFTTLERKAISGVILSNSCDIEVQNPRLLPTNVLFAPLIGLGKYSTLLLEKGRTQSQVEDTLRSIRTQEITSLFFLPNGAYGPSESLVMLDDIHAHPLMDFVHRARSQLFRLNQYGFYILLLKLSIHLSRFQEGVRRIA